MITKSSKVLDIVLIGSGISGLNFIDKYLEKKKILHVISPKETTKKISKKNHNIKLLPSQMRSKKIAVENYFDANQFILSDECKAIGVLDPGGLSNYWGLQIDNYLNNDQKNFNKREFNSLQKNFYDFINKFNLLGFLNKKDTNYHYLNDYKIPSHLSQINNKKTINIECKKPVLAFSKKNFLGNLNSINEKKDKMNAINFYKKIKQKKKIVFHKFYVDEIRKNKKNIEIICKNGKNKKVLLTKKVVFACGTIATTKILMKFLKIKHEVKIKHHPRLLCVYFSRKAIKSNLFFTPSLLQIVHKNKKDFYTADIRPGNKLITESIIDAFPYVKVFKPVINFLRSRLIFSNLLIDSSFSNIFLKIRQEKYYLYSKKVNLKKILRFKNKKIFHFLKKEKIIFPFYKTFFPGSGADYHYFGSIPFKKRGKLTVNNKCQLRSHNNIFIVDGSVFDFRSNKYPLGIVAANARRVANLLSK